MCGILGIYGSECDRYYGSQFKHALNLLKHRGPDHTAIWGNRHVVLGHSRLSIIDLSPSANQPLADRSLRFQIIFNGEIYNYLEIRESLRKVGVVFQTKSDAEVVLESYKQWGPECLHRFNGMWAFAIYDSVNNEIFISRDRFGVKPLYYSQTPQGLIFASEIKAILALGIDPAPNWRYVNDFAVNALCVLPEATAFQNIQQLPAGHFLLASKGHCKLNRWWNLSDNRIEVPTSFEERVQHFTNLFEDSVRLRLVNDVDTGVCLSGGLDSSAVYGAARKLKKNNLVKYSTTGEEKSFRVFSVSNRDSALDEYVWVKKCLEFWDDRDPISTVHPQPELFPKLIDEVVWHQEMPVRSASVIAFHALYRHVSSLGTKVILEGHGSDEMLGGYSYMGKLAVDLYSKRRNIPQLLDASRCFSDTRNSLLGEKKIPWPAIFLTALLFPGRWSSFAREKSNYRNSISPYLSTEVASQSYSKDFSVFDSDDVLRNELFIATTERILPMTLHVFDRASMAYSVESRAPFLDYRLVQFIFSLPSEDKISRMTKYILRYASKEWMPSDVRDRKAKLGFSIDEPKWFGSKVVQGYLMDIFHSVDVVHSPLLEGKKVAADLERCVKGGFSWQDTKRLWQVLNIYLWYRKFITEKRTVND